MEKNGKFKNFKAFPAVPALLLVLPLFSYPLLWKKLFSVHQPLWGEVLAVSPSVMGFAAFGAICLAPQARFRRLWETPRLRIFLLFAVAGIFAAALQQALYGGPFHYIGTAGFFFLLPVAGILYSNAFKRIFPLFLALLFLPVLFVTMRTPDLSGWAGNWNWNFSLLAVTASGGLFLFSRRSVKKGMWWALGIITGALVIVSCLRPELLPRGTFAGIIGSTVCLLVFRNISPRRRWAFALWATALTLVLFIGAVGNIFDRIRDSRFQLWRGSWECTLANFPLGIGFDRFESMINAYLPEIYYFTPFAAPRHPHSHNEFLNYAASYGLVGAVFFALLVLLVLRGMRWSDRTGLWLSWVVLLLGIHGQFDVLLSVPLTGTFFLLGAGAIAGNGMTGNAPRSKSFLSRVKAFAGCAVLAGAIIFAINCGKSGYFFRNARLALFRKDIASAEMNLQKSLKYHTWSNQLYTCGAVALFNFRDPDLCISYLERIKSELGLPMVYHSNLLLARSYAAKKEYAKSLNYFDEELKYYPLSALASGLRLSVLHLAEAGEKVISEEKTRFEVLMKMRGLGKDDLPKLIRNQQLDDDPLKTRDDE